MKGNFNRGLGHYSAKVGLTVSLEAPNRIFYGDLHTEMRAGGKGTRLLSKRKDYEGENQVTGKRDEEESHSSANPFPLSLAVPALNHNPFLTFVMDAMDEWTVCVDGEEREGCQQCVSVCVWLPMFLCPVWDELLMTRK
ncbi:hypothetical protein NQZ68_035060 [Dissostichus eleginoides]|nr:hypothetical protein NQZ68_035060 [Dissostichus eleginoides]